MIKVNNLRCDFDGMWMWTILKEDLIYGEDGWEEALVPTNYFTNTAGEGIFTYEENGNLKQITGTCQFCLNGYSVSGARKKIKRWFEV